MNILCTIGTTNGTLSLKVPFACMYLYTNISISTPPYLNKNIIIELLKKLFSLCKCHRLSLLVGPVDSLADEFLTLQGEFLYPH